MLAARDLALISIALLALAAPAFPRKGETGFLNRTVRLGGATYRYQVYVPAEWSKGKKWPVILFLHGAGERGDDGLIQTEVGIGSAVRRHPERVPAVVVLPQCRKEKWWTFPEMEAQAIAALDESIREFHGDPARVYLTWGSAPHPGSVACGDPNAPRRSLAGARVRAPPVTPLPYAVGPWQLRSWRNEYEILVSRRITG